MGDDLSPHALISGQVVIPKSVFPPSVTPTPLSQAPGLLPRAFLCLSQLELPHSQVVNLASNVLCFS